MYQLPKRTYEYFIYMFPFATFAAQYKTKIRD